jgi:hypothetical protein
LRDTGRLLDAADACLREEALMARAQDLFDEALHDSRQADDLLETARETEAASRDEANEAREAAAAGGHKGQLVPSSLMHAAEARFNLARRLTGRLRRSEQDGVSAAAAQVHVRLELLRQRIQG